MQQLALSFEEDDAFDSLCVRLRARCVACEEGGRPIANHPPEQRYQERLFGRGGDDAEIGSFPTLSDRWWLGLRDCPFEWTYDARQWLYRVVIDRADDPLWHGAHYPLATEGQVRAAEEAVGAALPPFLRAFYLRVANGTFQLARDRLAYWPTGGCPSAITQAYGLETIGNRVSHSGWRLHPHIAEALRRYPGSYVVCEERPDRFLEVGAGEQGYESFEVDGWTGAVYMVTDHEALPTDEGESLFLHRIAHVAPSLETFFEEWLSAGDVWSWKAHEQYQLLPTHVEPRELGEDTNVWRGLYLMPPREEPEEGPENE